MAQRQSQAPAVAMFLGRFIFNPLLKNILRHNENHSFKKFIQNRRVLHMYLKRKLGDFHLSINITKTNKVNSKLVDLMPMENSDEVEGYCQALGDAIENKKIKNIAITGPYGSGKSSLIKTFESKHAYKILNISLASFDDNSTLQNQHNADTNDKQNVLIERSILQQIFYGASANKIPYSRFKRITIPKHPLIKSFIMLLWCISASHLWFNGADIIGSTTLSQIASLNSLWVSLWISFSLSIPVVLAADIYKASFGLSFKKLSLTNAEIETGDIADGSILNKYIDEIIYFFQSTKYDVVVFEDLDRFGSPGIFVKLREINSLINENNGTTGNIKFLYALKDDMFANSERTKFFDIIIPILPVINSYNSLDKIDSRISECLTDKIDRQFLREASLYLNDLRLIHNIFNEFTVYFERLKSDKLNATKLLAMMIYKNVYPYDFEKLHHGSGALYRISQRRLELINSKRTELESTILEAKDKILKSERELEISTANLIKSFIGHICLKFNNCNIAEIRAENISAPLSSLSDWDTFASIIKQERIIITTSNGYYSNSNELMMQNVNEDINSNSNFFHRKENIENHEIDKQIKYRELITECEQKKKEVTQLPLNILLQELDPSTIETFIRQEGLSTPELFIYLVKNGYLDETYYLYTSNFHEGRMTINDRDFLLTIRDFKTPDPFQMIDTPEEVIENMRPDDFSHIYALNIILVDFIIENDKLLKLNAIQNYIANNFNDCDQFFTGYWTSGKQVHKLTKGLSEQWPEYAASCLSNINAAQHIALILSHVPTFQIVERMNKNKVITNYLAEHGLTVFTSDKFTLTDLQTVKELDVKIKALDQLNNLSEMVSFAHQHNLYEINKSNITYLMNKYSKGHQKEIYLTKNLTSLSMPGCEKIKQHISNNISEYINQVFLNLPDNTKEDDITIKFLLNHSSLNHEQKEKILSKQDIIFEDFSNIEQEWWQQVFTENKLAPSWKNLAEYLSSDMADLELTTKKIQEKNWLNELKISTLKNEVHDEKQLSTTVDFIFENDDINLSAYEALIAKLPYTWNYYPDVSTDKKITLSAAGKIELTAESFESSLEDARLSATLIKANLSEYLNNKDDYDIDDKIREELLKTDIPMQHKVELCHDISLSSIKSGTLVNLIAPMLALDDIDCSKIEQDMMRELILRTNNSDEKIQLLNKYIQIWSDSDLTAIIEKLPPPYCEIAIYGKRPKIYKNDTNLKLAELLESHRIISSFSKTGTKIQINTYKSSDTHE